MDAEESMPQTDAPAVQTAIDRDEFRKIWLLNDKQLLKRAKADLLTVNATTAAKAAASAFFSRTFNRGRAPVFSFSRLFKGDPLANEIALMHFEALILDHKRLDFTRKFASATQTTAPEIALAYLESFGRQLREAICEPYCKNKKEFLKLLKKHTRLSESDLAFLLGLAQAIFKPMIGILGFSVPLSFLILLLKLVLDKLCLC